MSAAVRNLEASQSENKPASHRRCVLTEVDVTINSPQIPPLDAKLSLLGTFYRRQTTLPKRLLTLWQKLFAPTSGQRLLSCVSYLPGVLCNGWEKSVCRSEKCRQRLSGPVFCSVGKGLQCSRSFASVEYRSSFVRTLRAAAAACRFPGGACTVDLDRRALVFLPLLPPRCSFGAAAGATPLASFRHMHRFVRQRRRRRAGATHSSLWNLCGCCWQNRRWEYILRWSCCHLLGR